MGTPDQDNQRSTTSVGMSGASAAGGEDEQQQDTPNAGSAAAATQEEQGQGDRSDEQEGEETTESKADSQTAEGSSQQSKSQMSGGGGEATEGSNCDASDLASARSTETGGKHSSGGTCSVASTATAEAAAAAGATGSSAVESSSNRHVATSRKDESSTSRRETGTSSNSAVHAKSDMEETTNASAPPQEQSQQGQSKHETEVTAAAAAAAGSTSRSDVDGTSSSRNARSSSPTPIEVMADQSGFNINLSSLPPGAYMVEPANPPVRRESYSNGIAAEGGDVLTAEVREADAGEVGAEEQSVAAASRSSISTITNPNFGGTSRSSMGWTAGTDARTGTGNTDDALHHVVTATCVDEEYVVDACPVPDEDEIILVQAAHEEQKEQIARLRKRQRFLLGGAIIAVVAIAVALGVAFSGGNNDNTSTDAGNSDSMGTASTAIDADRIEALHSIILPLSGEGAFNPTSPDFSEQRVSALNWLANDRYTTEQLPVDDPSLTWKIRQRYVMGLFHIMTDSPNWFDNFNGLSDRDECDWNRASSLDGKEAEDLFTGVQKEVEIKGVICNEMGRVKRIILWWNNLSGELPHELSYFSESLVDLNLFGGSLSGSIPDSYGNLTKLAGLSLAEHCLTGTVPESLSQLSDLTYFFVNGNPELRGSLNGLCDGDQFRSGGSFSYVSADCGDCPGSEAFLECDCCTCCDSNTFDCCDKEGNVLWKYMNLEANPLSGKPFSFDRNCLTEAGARWVQEECPCVVGETGGESDSKACSKDCSA